METFDYGNVERRAGKEKAWFTFGQEGRHCTNYVGLRNRISILSEATTYISFKDRVVGTDRFVTSILSYVAAHARPRIVGHDAAGRCRGGSAGAFRSASAPQMGVRFDFEARGTEDTHLERPLPKGSPPTTGRPAAIDKVKMPIYDRFKSTRFASFPAAYLIPPTETATLALLHKHGVLVERLIEGRAAGRRCTNSPVLCEPHGVGSAFQGHAFVLLDGTFRYRRQDRGCRLVCSSDSAAFGRIGVSHPGT